MNTNERGTRNAGQQQARTYGESATSGNAPHTAGHHKHDVLNKLDPRVDSSRDKQPMPEAGQHRGGGSSGVPEGTYGPHSSRTANALDPRVDSDLDSTGAGTMHGGGSAGAGITGGGNRGARGGVPEGTYGPHSSRTANALDPRVDSDLDRRGAGGVGGANVGGGGAGPHSSSVMNKLDPRVDSQTGASTGSAGAGMGSGMGTGRQGTGRGTGEYY